MANICLTSICNRECAYCFAKSRPGHPDYMSVDNFRKALSFLERSEIGEVRILGGEPTLHPQFKEILTLAKETRKKVFLFTNGLFEDDILEVLTGFSLQALAVMVNVTPISPGKKNHLQHQRHVIKELGPRAMLSFNIYRPDIPFDVLIELLAEGTMEKTVRLGIALPCLHEKNEYLFPHQYQHIGFRISRFAVRAAPLGIRLSFDCGFVPCMFTPEEMESLHSAEAAMEWRCSPILDINTAGHILSCFPLAEMFSVPLKDGENAAAVRAGFVEKSRPFRASGIYKYCSACNLMQSGICPGGCLAATIRRFR